MVNKLSIGTAQFGINYGINNISGKIPFGEAKKILVESVKLGINSLDTAEAYGDSEELIGSILNQEKLNFNITTKVKFSSEQSLEEKIKTSLKLLQCSKIENLLFHSFEDFRKFDINEKPKQVENIGVSIYTNEELELVLSDSIVEIIQLPFNLFDNKRQKGNLLSLAKSKGKIIQARSVFLQGLFFMELSTMKGNLKYLKPELTLLKEICQSYSLEMETLALNYVLNQKFIDKVIIGIDNLNQLLKNVRNLEVALDPQIINLIDEINIKRKDLLLPYNW